MQLYKRPRLKRDACDGECKWASPAGRRMEVRSGSLNQLHKREDPSQLSIVTSASVPSEPVLQTPSSSPSIPSGPRSGTFPASQQTSLSPSPSSSPLPSPSQSPLTSSAPSPQPTVSDSISATSVPAFTSAQASASVELPAAPILSNSFPASSAAAPVASPVSSEPPTSSASPEPSDAPRLSLIPQILPATPPTSLLAATAAPAAKVSETSPAATAPAIVSNGVLQSAPASSRVTEPITNIVPALATVAPVAFSIVPDLLSGARSAATAQASILASAAPAAFSIVPDVLSEARSAATVEASALVSGASAILSAVPSLLSAAPSIVSARVSALTAALGSGPSALSSVTALVPAAAPSAVSSVLSSLRIPIAATAAAAPLITEVTSDYPSITVVSGTTIGVYPNTTITLSGDSTFRSTRVVVTQTGAATGAPRSGPGAGSGSGSSGGSSGGIFGSQPAGASASDDSSPGPTTSTVVGGVIGGVAGLAVLLLLLIALLRWKKRRYQHLQRLGEDDHDGSGPKSSNPFAATAAALGFAGFWRHIKPGSTREKSDDETSRSFFKVSGRRVTPTFLTSPSPAPATVATSSFDRPSMEVPTRAQSPMFRDSHDFFAPSTASSMAGPDTRHINIMGPARTPFPTSLRVAPAPPRPSRLGTPGTSPLMDVNPDLFPVPSAWAAKRGWSGVPLMRDGVGRSLPSQDGSRASRFTEEIE